MLRKLSTEEYQAVVFKALGHPTRLTIISILADQGEKCVCELVDRLDFDQSTISKHLSVLRRAGIVDSRKEGLNVIYRLRLTCVHQFMKCVEEVMTGAQRHQDDGLRFSDASRLTCDQCCRSDPAERA